ncbi:corticotropin-releasing hormone receptor [Saccoglossus kowalevskii]|uniref:Corticotropin-releasing hormone receptor n=1 Tax=Saccoglossus kowalevskii TaxID=10224 RepID=D1LWZ1_SACKO|nr:corticotropin-releasing hormone receptor [Saccoglossus kowalevskii]ACY92497.1 corticotropin-releasing hormone receptor [Saccoglossus kowalevskii]
MNRRSWQFSQMFYMFNRFLQVLFAVVVVVVAGTVTMENEDVNIVDEEAYKFYEMLGFNLSDAAHVCLLSFYLESYPEDANGSKFCNTTHDRLTCWPTSRPGLVSVSCPLEVNNLKYDTSFNVTRWCYEDGTWSNKSDYSYCQLAENIYDYDLGDDDIDQVHYDVISSIMVFGCGVSLVALAVAFFIFAVFKSLRCVRNNIHWNLLSTFILRNVVYLVTYDTIDLQTKQDNGWPCRFLITVYNYFQQTNFFWMFVEGLYLHTVIVMAFQAEKVRFWIFMVIGWCLPLIFTFVWATVKYVYENEECWLPPKEASLYDYIYQGPILVVLLLNFIFLFNIVRVLITKLRASNSLETQQYRKAVKATVVLLPLLGLTYMLFFMNPAQDSTTARLLFLYFNTLLQSTQGLSVAVIYVFLNGEVRSVIRRKFNRWRDRQSIRQRRPGSRNTSIASSASKQGLTLNIFRDSRRKYSKESKTEIEVVSQVTGNGTLDGVEPTQV